MQLNEIYNRVKKFKAEANDLLSIHENSTSRVLKLYKTYNDLKELSLEQDDLFKQSLRCIENSLFRAAHVMSWAAFMDFLEEKISSDNLVKLHTHFPDWSRFTTIDILKEYVSEYQIIESTKKIGLCTKNQAKALQGLLNKRNECAHPSEYYPDLNETLGYISEINSKD